MWFYSEQTHQEESSMALSSTSVSKRTTPFDLHDFMAPFLQHNPLKKCLRRVMNIAAFSSHKLWGSYFHSASGTALTLVCLVCAKSNSMKPQTVYP